MKRKELYKIGLLVFVAAGVYLGFIVAFTYQPPVGRQLVLKAVAQGEENQIQQLPLLAPGTIFTTKDGKRYRMGDTKAIFPSPAGYVLCPNGKPVTTSPVTESDVRASIQCRDGTPLGPNCKVGTITYLCDPKTGLKIEQLGPTEAEYNSAAKKGTVAAPRFTQPHS